MMKATAVISKKKKTRERNKAARKSRRVNRRNS